jgi:hypothetical protein
MFDHGPTLPPIGEMFAECITDRSIVGFLADYRDYRFVDVQRKLLDIDEVETREGNPAKHNNIIAEISQ